MTARSGSAAFVATRGARGAILKRYCPDGMPHAYDEPHDNPVRSMRTRNRPTISVALKAAALARRRVSRGPFNAVSTPFRSKPMPERDRHIWRSRGATHRVCRFVNGTFAEVEVPQ
ncbi:hypothetical protein CUJ89_36755 [Burkholderia pyrrocinia]|uniref:Uncharacterized protein n=1 Tax=Burkholderia pyrrocinia TaxID=60550 RepID=A0A2Z5N8M7_BURPY|nr:hypothetical protein CUJ89_36755 [Burkholderia pyrrocinia]